MKALISFVCLLLSLSIASAEPFAVIVRHAEKATNDTKDPDLSSAGLKRAAMLSLMLKDAKITAIFTTELKRTQETAAPTAKSLGITATVVPGKDIPALTAKLREVKGNTLVVGHGNTIPDLMKALGIETPVKIDENDYSQLFVVTFGTKSQLLQLHYPNEQTAGE